MLFGQNEIVDVLTPGVNSPVELPDTIKAGTAVLKEGIAELKELSLQDFLNDITRMLVEFAINVTIAILVFYLGKFIIKRIYNIVGSIMVRRKVDNSLATFVLSFIKIILYFILIVTVIGILGVETSSFLAIFASAGVAIGMALSGTLQNFAGGVLLLLLKPYKVGDYVEAQGFAGTVREIQIFHTLITTYDNKSILIPNGPLST
ncbi:MAG: mechanosensitive ion channel, partial [Muribaculaceae bacterium]|nr:mechanosensitive ion channel [Muribaculaceae bacterium]